MTSFVNIHGEPVLTAEHCARQLAERRRLIAIGAGGSGRKPTVKNGYMAPPGTGPAGETCGTCALKRSFGASTGSRKHYIKCTGIQERWTHGEGTDILARSPACAQWRAIA